MGALGPRAAWLAFLAAVRWCGAELATPRNVSVTFLSQSGEQAFHIVSSPPTEWPEQAGTEIGLIPPLGVAGARSVTFQLTPGVRYRLAPTRCPIRLRINGLTRAQASKNGEYFMTSQARLGRPVYKHIKAEHFLHYWPEQKHWRLGESPNDLGAGVDSGDAAICPNQVTVWQEWNDTAWVPRPDNVTVQEECGTAYMVQNLPGVLGAYNGHYFMYPNAPPIDGRPVYHQRPGQAFLYYSQAKGTWAIGSHFQPGSSVHARSLDVGSRCPHYAAHWSHGVQGGGFVPHRPISITQLRLSHYDRFNGYLSGPSTEEGVMTYQEAESKCASVTECVGFAMQGSIRLATERAVFHLKTEWKLQGAGPPGGPWSSFRRTVEGSWEEDAAVAPADFRANAPGEITVQVVDKLILLSGPALWRKPFVPSVPLGMSPPLPPLTPDGSVVQVPARKADADFTGLLPEPNPAHEAAKHFYAERPVSVTFQTNVSGLLARLYWFCTRSMSRRPMAFITKEVREGQSSFVGHRYEVMVSGMEPKVMRVMDEGTISIGVADGKVVLSGRPTEDAPLHYRGERWDAIISAQDARCNRSFHEFPEDRTHFCSEAHTYRGMNRAKFDHTGAEAEASMVRRNFTRARRVQSEPQKFRNFTKRGFWVTKIPGELSEKLQRFFNESRRKAVPMELPWDDAVLPGRDSDVWKVALPDELATEAVESLRKGLEKFSKLEASAFELDPNTVRGSVMVHLYHEGAQVQQYVIPNIALSAYLEIGRNDPEDTSEWPLAVTDHSGVTHEVPSKVGQVIIVEAATCAVSRPMPFRGRQFAQLPLHFQVPGWPNDFFVASSVAKDKPTREEL